MEKAVMAFESRKKIHTRYRECGILAQFFHTAGRAHYVTLSILVIVTSYPVANQG